ncbi:hypothetical protein Bca4012_072910 [Brassica carinata]
MEFGGRSSYKGKGKGKGNETDVRCFVRCREEIPLDCGFFQWIDEEEPFGWQKQALIEARDEISEQKRTIMELKKTISHLQSDLGKNAEIEEDIINGFLNM